MVEENDGDGEDLRRRCDERALAEARAAGLYDSELEAVLGGRSPIDLVPPRPGEEPAAYADRAVSEMLILYITRWHGGPDG